MASNWQESEHPRDAEGKFTYKNGTTTSASNKDNFIAREDILYTTMQNETKNMNLKNIGLGYSTSPNKTGEFMTGGAADIVTDDIKGVKKGEPMSIEAALKGVNPDYNIWGNPTYKTNCQTGVVIFDARLRGFDLTVDIAYESDIKEVLSQRPNIAFIDPKTGKVPEFIKTKAKNEFDCINWLEQTVQKGERYLFAFDWKQIYYDEFNHPYNIGHIITVIRDKNNQLRFYDPQNCQDYGYDILSKIKYKFDWSKEPHPPKILRVDDKELNKKILNQISKPARKAK